MNHAIAGLKAAFYFFADATFDDYSDGMGLTWLCFLGLAELGAADDKVCETFSKILLCCEESHAATDGSDLYDCDLGS